MLDTDCALSMRTRDNDGPTLSLSLALSPSRSISLSRARSLSTGALVLHSQLLHDRAVPLGVDCDDNDPHPPTRLPGTRLLVYEAFSYQTKACRTDN
jgi:hypothetical protein